MLEKKETYMKPSPWLLRLGEEKENEYSWILKGSSNTASVIESFLPAIATATREAEREGNPRKHESYKP
jgi:hypothetical protein